MKITQHASPNFGYPRGAPGRRGHKIDAIFFHISGGSFSSTHSWIMQPRAAATYHYLIDMEGAIHQYVRDEDAAWSQGVVNSPSWPLHRPGINPNLHALSIARAGVNQNNWTPGQMASSVWLARQLAGKHDIPLRRPHIAGHFEVDSVNRPYCPGRAFFDALIAELKKPEEGEAGMLKTAIVINTFADFPAVEPLAKRLQAGIFLRGATADMKAETVIVAGGEAESFKGPGVEVVNLGGADRWYTAENVGNYFRRLEK